MDRHLWLIGMMGSGKSATGRVLGERWGAPFADTDVEVAARAGCSISQLWGERGEQAFRDMEAAAIRRLADAAPAVVATGGGAILDPANVSAMRASGPIAWLAAPPEVLSERVGAGAGRPLLLEDASAGRLSAILTGRSDDYRSAADLVLDTTGLSVETTADRIEAWWNEF